MAESQQDQVGSRSLDAIRTLNPGYFALVMATGVVSIGLYNNKAMLASNILFWVAGASYVILSVLYLIRLFKFRTEMVSDFFNPTVSFAFLTIVAGTGVLATRIAVAGYFNLALGVLAFNVILWILLGYGIPWASFFGRAEHPLLKNSNGTWLLWTVATQSIAVLAATLAPHFTGIQAGLALLAVCCWGIGLCLYVVVIISLHMRLIMLKPDPADFNTPYWISMGALAITILAGAKIAMLAPTPSVPSIVTTHQFISAASLLCWAVGTWLVPPILAVGYWRHVRHKIPIQYQPPLWSMVFPLGMYAASSFALGTALELPIVKSVGYWELWFAFAVWFVVFVGMLKHVTGTVLVKRSST